MGLLRRLVATGCAAVLLFSGCQAEEVDPNASLSAMEEQMYQDAFETYSKYFEMFYEIEQQGGAETLPYEIEQYVLGEELENLRAMMLGAWELGWYWSGVNVNRIESWQRGADPGPSDGGWFMSIEVCQYHEDTDLMNPDGTVLGDGEIRIVLATVKFAKDLDGVVKVYDVNNKKVESCPF